jgi:hypothetical protein
VKAIVDRWRSSNNWSHSDGDDRQHYAEKNGRANTGRYAEMVREDLSLRLAGYDIYRFGGKELEDEQVGSELVRQFTKSLLRKHGFEL